MSITAVTKPNGGKQTGTSYWSFGETQSTTGTPISRLQYTGRENDGTGLYYYRNRYYDPRIGRFASEDPKGFEAGINFYAYVGNDPIDANDPSGLCPSCIGAGTSVLMGGAIRYISSGGDLNATFDPGAMATDAVLGAVGAGLANKFSTISQLSKINNLKFPSKGLGDLAERLVGISPSGKKAIESLSGTATRRFPDRNLANITEVKNVAEISSRDAAQIYDSVLYDQVRGTTTELLTRGASTNISRVQNLIDDGLLNIGKIPGINSSGVANLLTPTSVGIGIGAGTFSSGANAFSGGGFLLYPNQPNSNQMQSIYQK